MVYLFLAEGFEIIEALAPVDMLRRANVDIDAISSGSLAIDYALGIGGYPKGRIVEIYGPESSGKTTLALHIIAEAQKDKGMCVFIDAEHALDPVYAERLGIQMDKLYISQPDSGEQALEIVTRMVDGKGDAPALLRKLHARLIGANPGDVDPAAHVENIEYHPERKLDREQILRLASCAYLQEAHNIIILGATGPESNAIKLS